jgi:uncharacterized Zn-binding protein involved in type VI secretion
MNSSDSKPNGDEGLPKEDQAGWNAPTVGGKRKSSYDVTRNYGDKNNAEEYAKDKKPSYALETGALYKSKKYADSAFTTKEGPDDGTFLSVFDYEARAEFLKASVDPDGWKASATLVEAKAKGSVVHAEWDIGDSIRSLFGIGDDEASPAGGMCMAPFAARLGDATTHLDMLAPGLGSPDVIIGFSPAWRAIVDKHACTKGPPAHVGGVVAKGAKNVLINFQDACRVGDVVVEIPGGPNPIAMGCESVMIGEAASISPVKAPKHSADLKVRGDLLTAEAFLEAKADIDVKEGKVDLVAKAGAIAAVAKADAEGSFNIPIPFTDYHFKVGGTAEVSALTLGAEGEASFKVNQVDPATGKKQLVSTKLGGKVGAALFGGGLGFSLGVEED